MTAPVTLLMSATIAPGATMPGSVNNDAATRLDEYLAAFRFYLSLPDDVIDSIVIAENSGSSLEPFSQLHAASGSAKRLILVPTSPDYDHRRGKGFGEFLMLDAAMRRLVEQGHVTPATRLWKVTGRLVVTNFAEMVRTSPPDYDLYCDLRHVPLVGERLGGNRWMELRLVAFTPSGYRRVFAGRHASAFVLEKAFFEMALPLWREAPDRIVPRFRTQPALRGTSGFSGKDYASPLYRMKQQIRLAGRKVAPWLWL